jgi:ribosomal protein S18 acetylase RimI-like enzyme
MLGAMYVAPEARGQQIGRALLDAALAHARSQSGIRQILLAVTVGNHAARHLYRAAGFVTWGIEPDYLCIGDQFYDIEWMIQMIDR